MPRKAKIIAVPIEQKEEEVASGDEAKTEAQEMTEILNEVKVDSDPSEPVVRVDQEPDPEPKPKAKARAKRAPKKTIGPEVEVSATLDEVVADVTLPVLTLPVSDQRDEPKSESEAECPDCAKQMSAKTLRYSHGPHCHAKKQKQSEPNIVPDVTQ